jgi:hypothetical protein
MTFGRIPVSITWSFESTMGSETSVTSIQKVSVGQKSLIWVSQKQYAPTSKKFHFCRTLHQLCRNQALQRKTMCLLYGCAATIGWDSLSIKTCRKQLLA